MGSSLPFDRKTLILPDGTHFLERTIETHGDVVLGDHTAVEYGLATPGSAFLGEGVEVQGDLTTGGDTRIDHFSTVLGEVKSKGSAYLAEGVRIAGRLSVEQDLDVGDDVTLEEGFEARGWINIRNPIPVVVYLFIYLLQLMRQGRSEEVERILRELDDADETFQVADTFLFIPGNSKIGLEHSTIKGGLAAGVDCRILGNFQVEGPARLDRGTELHGSLRAREDVDLGPDSVVHGDLEAWGEIRLGEGALVHGQVQARRVELMPGAEVMGTIVAPEGVQFLTETSLEMQEKVKDFNDGVRNIADMLE